VAIELSGAGERRELFALAHGLTARESELPEHLAGGADTKAAASQLHVSEYTVQDHLKSIFAKTGARNRRTLFSRVTWPLIS
jgi:DNA-binding NarL/FixJ family response regulator